ncbi:EF-hand domain-containing protein [uncultured Paludibaculum sp.]|uniref:EF-hand domain-containing protein n=1 Tax=uncultured Paludibaculum sp. TaxID=1765020 RepID=UPI002AAA6A74|nr:EF-hand domain-containing protein [uncultured Paludibaculum sp.]
MLSSIGSLTSTLNASSTAQTQSKVVDKMFEKVDTNKDGQITKDELAQSLESGKSQADSSGKKLSVDELFQMLDSGGKGYITKEDAAAGLDAMAQKLAEAKSKTSGGGESTGGGGGAKGAGASGASSTSTDYDPKDTNQDGTVSLQEELAYVMKHYAKTDAVEISTQESSTETYA